MKTVLIILITALFVINILNLDFDDLLNIPKNKSAYINICIAIVIFIFNQKKD